jgi:UPF0271 protein
MAAKNEATAAIIAQAVKDVSENLVLYGLYNSYLILCARQLGLATADEVFADRAYDANGKLASRNLPGAVFEDATQAAGQVLRMVLQNQVNTITGEIITVQPQTLCLHGDGKHAVAFAKMIYQVLADNKIRIRVP